MMVRVVYDALIVLALCISAYGINLSNIWQMIMPSQTHIFSNIEIVLFKNGNSEHGEVIVLNQIDCGPDTDFAAAVISKSVMIEGKPGYIFNETGSRVESCMVLMNETRLFFVERGRVFIWPSFELGHLAVAPTVKLPVGYKPIMLETVSQAPRVFRIYNFFTEEESDYLVSRALSMQADAFRLKRSSTGTNGYSIDDMRTSENAFDVSSEVAMRLKHRSFDLLGISPYDETWADGLQILRYNQTTAYINHLDYIESTSNDHDWNSAGEGTNRFATILLYLSDVEDGGETFFPESEEWFVSDGDYMEKCQVNGSCGSSAQGHVETATLTVAESKAVAASYLEQHNISHLFPEKSWQRRMVANCRSRMSIKPVKAQAILFYSQYPDGAVDRRSMHGGCPVLQGVKWAANLWVWNGPRHPYLFQQKKSHTIPQSSLIKRVKAEFQNIDVADAELYWEDQFMGVMPMGHTVPMDTFEGHRFTARVKNEVVMNFVVHLISKAGTKQKFALTSQGVKLFQESMNTEL